MAENSADQLASNACHERAVEAGAGPDATAAAWTSRRRQWACLVAVGLLLCLPGCGQVTISDLDAILDPADTASDETTATDGDDGGEPDDGTADPDAGADGLDPADAEVDGGQDDATSVDAAADTTAISDATADIEADAGSDADAAGDADADTLAADAETDAGGSTTCNAASPCPGALVCNLDTATCVECNVDAHCQGAHARCQAGTCLPPRPCASDAACVADKGVCAPFGFCVDCLQAQDCGAGQACVLFQCVPAPKPCPGGATDCKGATPICGDAGSCLGCETSADCAKGELCAEGLCTPPVCQAGGSLCLGANVVGLCQAEGNGWTAQPCADGQGCEGGQCKPWVCVPGSKTCAGGIPTSCPPDGLAWQLGKACVKGELCIEGACTKAVCKPGATECTSDGKLQTCAADGSAWGTAACPSGQACAGGACLPVVCAAGSTLCVGDALWLCNPSGTNKTLITNCAGKGGFCAEGECTSVPCKPGDAICKGQARLVCAADGASWSLQDCSSSADDKCAVSACDPATKQCKAGAPKLCDDANPCTKGSCEATTGDCKQVPIDGACDDGSACTTGDTCADGACAAGEATVEVFSGAKIPGAIDGPSGTARFAQPFDVAAHPGGALVVADRGNHRIRAVATDGSVKTLAGAGVPGFLDGPAATALFSSPSGVAVSLGWVVVADRNNHRVRRVSPDGVVTTIAGTGAAGDADGPASAAQLYAPEFLAIDGKGVIFVVEPLRHRIRRIGTDGAVTTFAGSAAGGFTDGQGSAAKFSTPQGVAIGLDGALLVADSNNNRIRRVALDGAVTTLAGTGLAGAQDGAGAKASFKTPLDVVATPDGVLVVDAGNVTVRRIGSDADATVTTIAGIAGQAKLADGPVSKATFQSPRAIWVAPGVVGVSELSQPSLRRVRSAAVACDDGQGCTKDACDAKSGGCSFTPLAAGSACDDGDACTVGEACSAAGACVGKAKSCDDANPCTDDVCNPWLGTCIQQPNSAPCDDGQLCTWGDHCVGGSCSGGKGWVETVAGSAAAGSVDGTGVAATFTTPVALLAPIGASAKGKPPAIVWVLDRDGHRVRSVETATWAVKNLVGSSAGYLDGVAATARFSSPRGFAQRADGTLIIADGNNQRIRAVTIDATSGAATQVSTLAGEGVAGYVDGPAAKARFQTPHDVAVAADGTVYVADLGNLRIRRITASGVVSTLAGSGVSGTIDGAAGVARFVAPVALTLMGNDLLVSDRSGHKIRRVAIGDGAVSSFVGSGIGTYLDGPAATAGLPQPTSVAVGPDGRLWLTSNLGSILVVRNASTKPVLERVTKLTTNGFADGTLETAAFASPNATLPFGDGLLVADTSNRRLRLLTPAAPPCNPADGPCTAGEVCQAGTGTCLAVTPSAGAACDDGPCAKGVCAKGICADTKPVSCDDGKPCTLDLCDGSAGGCQHVPDASTAACCQPTPWAESFEAADVAIQPSAPSFELVWARQALADATKAKDGKAVLAFGKPAGEEFGPLAGYASGSVEMPAVTLPVGTALQLTAQVKFDLAPLSSQNRLFLRLRAPSTGMQVNVSTVYGNKPGWQTVSADLSAWGGQTVHLLLFAQLAPNGKGVGLWVDDMKIAAACKAKACVIPNTCGNGGAACIKPSCTKGACAWQHDCCVTASDCDDGKPCTLDLCNNGNCSHQPIPNCCASKADCVDADTCISGACPTAGGQCVWSSVAGCCKADSDCDDGVACTADTCTASQTCKHTDICCKSNLDCDDGTACTADACVGGFCSWTWKQLAGCCQPVIGPWNFESSASLSGWTRLNCPATTATPATCTPAPWTAPTQGWQLWNPAASAQGGTGALYYGDPATKSYAWGNHAGAVRSPPMKVQPGKSTLEFWVRWETEGGTNYDRLMAWLWVGGARVDLTPATAPTFGAFWVKGVHASTPSTWSLVSLDVSAYAGKDIALEIYFTTWDAAGNSTLGVLVDDVRLVSTCQ